jgi:hypothetical protein
MKGTKGIYMSKSFKSTIIDWAPYVSGKKANLHPLCKQIQDLHTKVRSLENKIEKLETSNEPQDVKDFQKLKSEFEIVEAKLEKLLPSFNSDKYRAGRKGYTTLYVHTVQCNKSVYKEALKRFIAAYKKDLTNHKDDSLLMFSFWNWGDQIFIPYEYVEQLQILKVTAYSQGDFAKAYHECMLNRHLDNPCRLYMKEFERTNTERVKKKDQTESVDPPKQKKKKREYKNV